MLCLDAGEAQKFASDEVGLLQELADNLAFGIGNLRACLECDRSQEAARQAAAQLLEQASLMDQVQDAIMVRNLDGTLRFWNQGAKRLFGWTAGEVLGKAMHSQMYCDPGTLDRVKDQLFGSDGLWTGQVDKYAKDGAIVAVEARWSLLHDE
ncbi:MAG: PAS domain-containing protein, partial [Polaromonas sp.]